MLNLSRVSTVLRSITHYAKTVQKVELAKCEIIMGQTCEIKFIVKNKSRMNEEMTAVRMHGHIYAHTREHSSMGWIAVRVSE